MLDKKTVQNYLEAVRCIGQAFPLIDMHVHPFDVMFSDFNYTPNRQYKGVFTNGSSNYTPPTLQKLQLTHSTANKRPQVSPDLQQKMALLSSRRVYAHVGPRALKDHMNLSGIQKVLLLPVTLAGKKDNGQMETLVSLFGNDEKFCFGYCLPNDTSNKEIPQTILAAKRAYNIKAIKIHPNITDIDTCAAFGQERIECILRASQELQLPVIVHGGKSSEILGAKQSRFSTLENLHRINWNLTSQTVVIAHAGTYGYDDYNVEKKILPLMNYLLSKYDNMAVDISGLAFSTIQSIVKQIDADKILFGSDALYTPQWCAIIYLLHALYSSVKDYERRFIKIVSSNPERLLQR